MELGTVQPGDILAIRGNGFLGRAILRLTDAAVSHVGVIITASSPLENSLVIEALARVRTRVLSESIARATKAWVLSPLNATAEQRQLILERALTFSAHDYGYADLVLQLTDALTHGTWFTDHLTFGLLNQWPICSYVAGVAYQSAGLTFGKINDVSLTPGDIWNFAIRNQDKYRIRRIK